MGKFDHRDSVHGEGSCPENSANANTPGKIIYKNRKFSRSLPYFSDPLLIPRINQYLAENKDKVYIDINDMVNGLQSRYRDYARRKRNVFRQAVQKAFTTVLQECGIKGGDGIDQDEGQMTVGSTDNSSSEVEECNIDSDKLKSSSNSQLINLYKPRVEMMSKNYDKNSSQGTELIDLSSDDENVKKKDVDEGAMYNNRAATENNVTENHAPSNQISPCYNSLRKITAKPGMLDKVLTISRKRKFAMKPDKVHIHLAKDSREPFQEPKVTFADFAGNTRALEEVCKLILHVNHPEFYRRIGLTSPRGFLLHGPPGCGKTLLASAIAGELDVHFIKVSAPELVGGVSGESEERIRELFNSATDCAPCVLFIDEIDAITPNRQNAQREMERRIVAQLLSCFDELNSSPNGDQVLVIGATNRPDSLDPALRRAGRFDREVCLGIPDLKAREEILRVLCKDLKMSPSFSYEEVALNTPGFVGADLLALTREAGMAAVNRVFGALHTRRERKNSKTKKMKLDSGDVKSVAKASAGDTRHSSFGSNATPAENDGRYCAGTGAPAFKEKGCCSGPKGCDRESDCKGQCGGDAGDSKCAEIVKGRDGTGKAFKSSKENDQSVEESDETDMDVTVTVSEGSVNGDINDIEICKEDSMNASKSEDESDVEVLLENHEVGSPSLDTLLLWLRSTPPLTSNELDGIYLIQDDFNNALHCVQPSAKREGFATVPDVTWDDVGSLADIREELKMSILGPVKMRKQFEDLGLTAPAGILICGPPGCGKTLLAKAIANEAGINFISVKGPELLNMYVGESERAVRQCFQRARNSAPCVIFFDELDALCPKRSGHGENGASMRVVNQMLTEMDGIEGRQEVYLMAATNRPDIVDPAVLRPGRLDKILYVGLPEESDRCDILRALTKNGTRPRLGPDVNLEEIARRRECSGYSGADLAALVREAGVQALKDLIKKSEEEKADPNVSISMEHFERALKAIRPSVSRQDREHYEKMKGMYCGTRS